MALNSYRLAANVLTATRALGGVALMVRRPSLAIVALAIATDWIDGTLARRGGDVEYGARFDLEADSLLTLGTAVAAVRRGSAPAFALFPPVARYAAVSLRDPRTLSRDEILWDRLTGIAQMVVLVAALASVPRSVVGFLAGPVTAARCAALAAFVTGSAVHSTPTQRPAEARLVLSKEDR